MLLGDMRTLATISRAADVQSNIPQTESELRSMNKGQLVDFLNGLSDMLSQKAARIPNEFADMAVRYEAGDSTIYDVYRENLSKRLQPSTTTDYDAIWRKAVRIRSAKLGSLTNASPSEQLARVKSENPNWQALNQLLTYRTEHLSPAAASGTTRDTNLTFTAVPLSPNGLNHGGGLSCEMAFLSPCSRMQPALCTDLDTTIYEAKLPDGATRTPYGDMGTGYSVMTDQYNAIRNMAFDPNGTISFSGNFKFERASEQLSLQQHMVPTAQVVINGVSSKLCLLGEAYYHDRIVDETRSEVTDFTSSITLSGNMAVLGPQAEEGIWVQPGGDRVALIEAHSMLTRNEPARPFEVTRNQPKSLPDRVEGVAVAIAVDKLSWARGSLMSSEVRSVIPVGWTLESVIGSERDIALEDPVKMTTGDIIDCATGEVVCRMGNGYDAEVGRMGQFTAERIFGPTVVDLPTSAVQDSQDIGEFGYPEVFGPTTLDFGYGATSMLIASSTESTSVAASMNAGDGKATLAIPVKTPAGTAATSWYATETNELRGKRIATQFVPKVRDFNAPGAAGVLAQMTQGGSLEIKSEYCPITSNGGRNYGHASMAGAIYKLESTPIVVPRTAEETIVVLVFPDPSSKFEMRDAPSFVISNEDGALLTDDLLPQITTDTTPNPYDIYSSVDEDVPVMPPAMPVGRMGAPPQQSYASCFSSGAGRPPNVVIERDGIETAPIPGGTIVGYKDSTALGGRMVFGALPLAKKLRQMTSQTAYSAPDIGYQVYSGSRWELSLEDALDFNVTQFPRPGYTNPIHAGQTRVLHGAERTRIIHTAGPQFKRYGVFAPMKMAYGHVIPTATRERFADPSSPETGIIIRDVSLQTNGTTLVAPEKAVYAWFHRSGSGENSSARCPATIVPDRVASLVLMRRDGSVENARQSMKVPVPPQATLSGVFDVEQKDGSTRPEWHEITGSLEEAIQTFGPLNRRQVGFNSSGLSASIGTGTIYQAIKKSVNPEAWKTLQKLYNASTLPGQLPDDPESLYYMTSVDFQRYASGLTMLAMTSALV